MKSHSMIAMLALAFMATGIRNVPAVAPAQLRIEAPWARETAEGQRDGGGFMTIVNDGKTADQLVAASSPVSSEVQIHTVQMPSRGTRAGSTSPLAIANGPTAGDRFPQLPLQSTKALSMETWP